MLSYELTIKDKQKILNYRSMLFSSDKEVRLLGITLIDEEFGDYSLYDSLDYTLHNIIYLKRIEHGYSNIHAFQSVGFWLFFAHNRDYLYKKIS